MNDKMTGYKIFKNLLSFIYKIWYNPKVIGKENIPNKERVIIVGNHVHLMDQCNVIIATKRNIHYLAKKEYFDNKKVAWFFKASGCIPVDRSKKDESATDQALEVLKNNHALGIFPEGTRNILREEQLKKLYDKYISDISYHKFKKKMKKAKKTHIDYLEKLVKDKKITKLDFINNIYRSNKYLLELINNKTIKEKDYYNHFLLPLKFGAVSLSKKTDSLIIPYAITGDYKFRSKDLTIRIGKGFKAGDDLEKANQKLKEEIEKLIKESLKV